MSSGYFASDEAWWVSNGIAELLDEGWARHIRARGNADSPGSASLLALLDELVEMSATGMLGFAFDNDVPMEARPILRTAIADFAREFVAAVEGDVRHESLAFVARLELPWVAWGVATHYALYEMIGTAMGEPHRLELGLAPDLDAAARGYRVPSSPFQARVRPSARACTSSRAGGGLEVRGPLGFKQRANRGALRTRGFGGASGQLRDFGCAHGGGGCTRSGRGSACGGAGDGGASARDRVLMMPSCIDTFVICSHSGIAARWPSQR